MIERERSHIGRFVIRRRIGAGGMGVVYEALDPQSATVIAVKRLARAGPSFVDMLKQEFRSLAEILHPNLVLLYELFSEDDEWFFTMEYVDGISLLNYVYNPSSEFGTTPPSSRTEERTLTFAAAAGESGEPLNSTREAPRTGRPDFARLRSTLLQLAEGMSALHDAGKLHRDIKPSNILVTPEERVVLLDFGLAMELDPVLHSTADQKRAGTVAYMAPEQSLGQHLTPAADWYAMGTLLYEALTGELPYTGNMEQVMRDKQRADVPRPEDLRSDLPEDLCRLSVDLMQRDPERRPRAPEVIARLASAAPSRPRYSSTRRARHVLRGREAELGLLRRALEDAREGRHIALYLTGPSGMGKTALIGEFLRSASAERNTRVLTGRCYEQEFVPYKALDGVVDSLSRWLAELPDAEVREMLPADAGALARLFPALLRVAAIRAAADVRVANVQELRQRAFAALRQLLRTLGERTLLCIFIDDLQWGDPDSAVLLNELLHSPAAPRLLFLGSYRSENASDSAFLKAVLISPPAGSLVEQRRMEIGPLSAGDAETFARDLFQGAPYLPEDVARVVNEAQGVPYFIEELAQYACESSFQDRAGISLDEALWLRVQALSGPLRALLEAVAVFGRPLAVDTALDAAALTGADRYAFATLRKSKLVRSGASADQTEVDTFHDRVRDIVRGRMQPDAKRAWHTRLADALERSVRADAEALAVHHLGAGRPERAAPWFVRAAEQSAAALAFDRAAAQYEAAIAAGAWPDEKRRQLQVQLGDALANAGRAEAAAHVWEEALPGDASATEALELKRRIGYYYCVAGRQEAGRAVFADVLRPWRASLPRTSVGAMLSLARSQARLRFRGMDFHERAEAPEQPVRRIDVLWSVGSSIAIFDLITGYDFMTRCLACSLDAGEPYRLGRALAFQAALEAAGGHVQRSDELLARCESIASRIDNPHLLGMLEMGRGIRNGCRSEFRGACERLEQAARIFREQCTGVAWELATTHQWWLYMLQSMGDYANTRRLSAELLRQAGERGDLLTVANICSNTAPHLCLLDDDPQAALDALNNAAPGPRGTPHRLLSEISRMYIDVYAGRAESAYQRVRQQRWQMAWYLRIMPPTTRVQYLYAMGCCALAAADGSANAKPYIEAAEQCVKKLKSDRDMPLVEGLRRILLAGIAAARGESEHALECAFSAAERLDALESVTLAAVMRRRAGQLRGGEAGARQIAEADEFLMSRTMRRPEKIAATWGPGFRRYS